MNRPYIVCHMAMSIDGRIDCGMLEKIPGDDEYYNIMDEMNLQNTLSGKTTAELEMALGKYTPKNKEAFNKEIVSKKRDAQHYSIVVDTKGSLEWPKDNKKGEALLIITSQQVTKEYLEYLDMQNISYIVTGKEGIDLPNAMVILKEQFGIERMAVVGGGHINAGFLKEHLLDELSILVEPGIDGRAKMTATFDGLSFNTEPVTVKLTSVKQYENGGVWLRYTI